MLKKFRCLALVLALILVVVSSTTFAAKKPIKVICGSQYPPDHLYIQKGDLLFKKLVEKNSEGQILVEVYPNKQLGSIPEQIQAVRSNAQQITFCPVGSLVPYWSKLGTFDVPYLYRNKKHYSKVVNKFISLIDQDEMGAKAGFRILSIRVRTPRQLTTKFPVNKLEDIKGLKIRVPEDPISVALWKALGAIPTIIPAANMYTSLATGVVDAQENPLSANWANKIYEQTKYCAMTNHKFEINPVIIGNDFWKSLTVAHRKIIQKAMDKVNKYANRVHLNEEKKYQNLLAKKGMIFTKPNLAPFRKRAKTIWKQFGDDKVIQMIQAIK
jgi:tripartite ATP-independent transporter DctP family solute receptor